LGTPPEPAFRLATIPGARVRDGAGVAQRRRGRQDDAPHGLQQLTGPSGVEASDVDTVQQLVEISSRVGQQLLATFRHLLQDGARGGNGVAGVLEGEAIRADQHDLTIDNVVGP
jgi:hypothetical protein